MNVPIPTDYDPESPNQTVYDLPRGTGFLKGPTTGGWVTIGSPQPEPGPFDQIGKLAEQAYATMPAQEAEAAVASAIQFQGLRGYNRDMQSGKSANEAIAKWGPAMFYRSPQTLAQVMKANPTPANYAWTPGQGGAPGAFMAPGQRPVIPTQSQLPQAEAGGTPEKVELFPNVYMVRHPGSDRWQILDRSKTVPETKSLTPGQAATLLSKMPEISLMRRMATTDPKSKAQMEALEGVIFGPDQAPKTNAAPAIPGSAPLSQTSAVSAPAQRKIVDKAIARQFILNANGDLTQARELAKKAGYTF